MRRAAFLIAVLVAFAVMTSVVAFRVLTPEPQSRGGWGGRTMPVAAHTVRDQNFADIVEALGTARADETVTITARVSDTISALYFDSGQRVEAGDILVELTDTEEAAGLAEARATLREAQSEYDRVNGLVERGIASRQRLDEVSATVSRARARVSSLEAQLADRIVRAPFSGIVGLREVSVGGLVRPGDAITSLDDTRVIKLDFTVPERFLASLRPGLPVEAVTSAYPREVFAGSIAQIDSRIDPVTRAVTVRAEIANDDARLLPGQLMAVEIERDVRRSPAIPGSAITRYLDDSFVFVLIEEGEAARIERRRIELGRREGSMVEVTDGIEDGELIVRDGVHRVREGMRVSITERNEPAMGGSTAGVAASQTSPQ